MKYISLTRGMSATVDYEDFEFINQFNWCVRTNRGSHYYAVSKIGGKIIYMHRLIMNAKPGEAIDHIDGNGLNNTRINMRLATQGQNNMNSIRSQRNTSGFKGVSYCHDKFRNKPWRALIRFSKRLIHIGCFDTPEEAAIAYNKVALLYFGEFARINIISHKDG